MSKEIDVNSISEAIKNALSVVPAAQSQQSDRRWTTAVKDAICGVARSWEQKEKAAENRVCATGCDKADDGEWLYDLVWYQEPRSPSWRLQRLVLVMECEWSLFREDQQRDFQKLLIAKAPFKLFVFQGAGKTKGIDPALKEFGEMIKAFEPNHGDEYYLFAALDIEPKTPHEFHFGRYDRAAKSVVDWSNHRDRATPSDGPGVPPDISLGSNATADSPE